MNEYRMLIRRVLQGAWRRRHILLILTVLLSLVSVSAAFLQKRTYVARTLLLLQEGDRINPLTREPVNTPPEPIQARITSLKAILFSDYVLSEVINRTDPSAPIAGRQLTLKMQGLKSALSLDLVGSEVIELRLSGNDAKELGNQLAIVVESLLQTMMPQESGTTAAQLLINKQQSRLHAAQEANANFRRELGEILPEGLQSAQARVADLERALTQLQTEPQKSGSEDPSAAQKVTQSSIAMTLRNEAGSVCLGRAAALALPEASDKSGQLTAGSDQAWAAGLLRCDDLEPELKSLREKIRRYERLMDKVAVSDREVDSTRNSLREYEIRLRGAVKSPGSSILKAPERIRIVDPPRDPDLPTKSRLLYAIAGLLGSIAFAVVVALVTDYFDDTVFYPEELAAVENLPIVAAFHSTGCPEAAERGNS